MVMRRLDGPNIALFRAPPLKFTQVHALDQQRRKFGWRLRNRGQHRCVLLWVSGAPLTAVGHDALHGPFVDDHQTPAHVRLTRGTWTPAGGHYFGDNYALCTTNDDSGLGGAMYIATSSANSGLRFQASA